MGLLKRLWQAGSPEAANLVEQQKRATEEKTIRDQIEVLKRAVQSDEAARIQDYRDAQHAQKVLERLKARLERENSI